MTYADGHLAREPAATALSDGRAIDLTSATQRVDKLRAEYQAAQPWPHLVLHGLFPDSMLTAAKREAMQISASELKRDANRAQVKDETTHLPGPVSEELFRFLDGAEFTGLLEGVTGVKDLLPDPTHLYGGLHRFPAGGFTLVHRDFRRHPVTTLHHRVNALLYLNEDWKPEYGGFLELWPSDMSAAAKTIAPQKNTLVMWETHDQTLHGLPDPLKCPEHDARVALAAYYYTREPRAEKVKRRGPVVVRRPQDPWTAGRRGPKQLLSTLIKPNKAF